MAKNEAGFQGMLNRKAAAAYVGISETTFRKYLKTKNMTKPKFYKLGMKMLFRPEWLSEWMESFLQN